MDDKKLILLNIADDLNETQSIEQVRKYFVEYSKKVKENEQEKYNLIVFFLGMCVNKELTILLENVQNESDDDFPKILLGIHSKLINEYQVLNQNVVEILGKNEKNLFFLEYLNEMTKRLLSGIKYIERGYENFVETLNGLGAKIVKE